ncbi:MAG: mannosyltransferase, partial [Sphingobacteriia bacterium]
AKSHESHYTCLVANPSDKDLQDMIGKAHVHILPLGVSTGTSAKILNALYNGRHVVTNEAGVWGTDLAPAVHVGKTAQALQAIVTQLYHLPFTEEEIALRQKMLSPLYDNAANARKQVGWIWGKS